jgi:uncharacterized protein (TIGR03437 family)
MRISRIVFQPLLAAILLAVPMAGQLFLLPDPYQDQATYVFQTDLSPLGSIPTFGGSVIDLFIGADADRYFAITASGADTLVTLDRNFQKIRTWSALANGHQGQITPDGRRVLVLTAAGLLIHDAATSEHLAGPLGGCEQPARAVSDSASQHAFLLCQQTRTLVKIDLSTGSIAAELPLPASAIGALARAPNGMLYASGPNRLFEISSASMNITGQITLPGSGQLSTLEFTPDGRYVLAWSPGGSQIWVADLDRRTARSVLLQVGVLDVTAIDNSTGVVRGDDHRLYEITLPEANVNQFSVWGIGQPAGVKAIAKSNEIPRSKFLYFLSANGLYRVRTADRRLDPPAPVSIASAARKIVVADAPSTHTPARLLVYNSLQQAPDVPHLRPLLVRVLDVNGMPVYGVPVNFKPGTPALELSGNTVRTGIDGIAAVTVNSTGRAGTYTVGAEVGELTATFSVTVGAVASGQPLLAIKSGNGQVIRVPSLSEPLVISLRDSEGKPVKDAPVNWSVEQGPGRVIGAPQTNARGEAEAVFYTEQIFGGLGYVQSRVRATTGSGSVDFYVTAVPFVTPGTGDLAPLPSVALLEPQTSRAFSAKAGARIPNAFRIQVRVAVPSFQQGQPIPNVGLTVTADNAEQGRPAASCVGGTVLTDEQGEASCDLDVGGILGSTNLQVTVGGIGANAIARYVFPLTVDPGDPAAIRKLRGDKQRGRPGELLPSALLVEVVDAFGNLLPYVPVRWVVTPSNIATLEGRFDATNQFGQASTQVRLASTAGEGKVSVHVGAISTDFTFAVELVGANLRKISGDNQTAQVNQEFPEPLKVQLTDKDGRGVANTTITFAVGGADARLLDPVALTDSDGFAVVRVIAGNTAGSVSVTASFGSAAAVIFNLIIRPPGPILTAANFVSAASGAPGLVPGSIAKITARGIASNLGRGCVTSELRLGRLPLELEGVVISFEPEAGGRTFYAPLYYVCSKDGEESAAFQVPFELPVGTVTATVQAGGGSATTSGVVVRPYDPGIFETPASNGLRHAVVMRPDGTFVSEDNPARRGEILRLFATGLGAVEPASATNAAGQGQTVKAPVIVGINNEGVRVLRSEYAVNMIGVYVVAFELPIDTTPGPNRPLALAVFDGNTLIFGNGSSIPIQ